VRDVRVFLRAATVAVVLASFVVIVPTIGAGARPAGPGSNRSDVQASGALPGRVPCPRCWHPKLRVSWQWQLQSPPKASELLDVRMYDVDEVDTSKALVRAMHRRGIKAVCYISAGSWENWRPDATSFPKVVLGRPLSGWPGERWLDVRRLDVLGPLMEARLDVCAAKGFDGVEFDNVDGYTNHTGFPLTGADQLRYDGFLANQAHRRRLTAFLKNDLGQVRALLPYFDAALNEQCFQYTECFNLTPFVDAGKPVFGVEYAASAPPQFCAHANDRNFNFLEKHLALGAWRIPCRGR
jgi:hypothetical protein